MCGEVLENSILEDIETFGLFISGSFGTTSKIALIIEYVLICGDLRYTQISTQGD